MTELVCLLSKSSDYEDGYEISYILPEDDEYVKFWIGERFESMMDGTYHKIRPYKEGDIAMTTGNKIMLGLQIIFKYDRNLEFNEAHDEVFAGGKSTTYEQMVKVMSGEDLKEMERLGWTESEYEGWHHWT